MCCVVSLPWSAADEQIRGTDPNLPPHPEDRGMTIQPTVFSSAGWASDWSTSLAFQESTRGSAFEGRPIRRRSRSPTSSAAPTVGSSWMRCTDRSETSAILATSACGSPAFRSTWTSCRFIIPCIPSSPEGAAWHPQRESWDGRPSRHNFRNRPGQNFWNPQTKLDSSEFFALGGQAARV